MPYKDPEKTKACKRAWEKANPERCKAYHKNYYEANREDRKAKIRAYYKENSEKLRAYQKAYRKAHPYRELQWDYGISRETWEQWFKNQKGRCPITGIKFGDGNARPVVHHNHFTGHPEGLWSNAANAMEGFLLKSSNDPIRTLERLMEYYQGSELFHPPKYSDSL